jgi:hypothetical protein
MTDTTDVFAKDFLDEASSIIETSCLENNDELENPVNKTDIDELTLSLLMNQNHYRKYVAQINPEQANMDNQTIDDNRKYRDEILKMTATMIDTPDFQISTDISQIFNAYTRQLIRHLKMKDFDKQNKYHNGWHETNDNDDDDDDDGMLFGNMDDVDGSTDDQGCMTSLWGKERVIKKGNVPIANYDMRMFSKKR